MKTSLRTTRRLARRLVLAFVVAAIAAPAAQARPELPGSSARAFDYPVESVRVRTPFDYPVESVRVQAPAAPLHELDPIELVRAQPREISSPEVVTAPGFDWADAGIGAGMAFGAMLLAAAAALVARSRRRIAHS